MKITCEVDRREWSDFVRNHPHGNVFQTPDMYEVYRNTKNHDPVFLGVVNDCGETLATMLTVIQREYSSPVGALTSRAITWGGPLVKNDDEGVCRFILSEYDKVIGRVALYSQFRNLWDAGRCKHLFSSAGYVYEDHLNILVDLSKPKDMLWAEIHSKRRNEIRRAIKEGTGVRELKNAFEVERAYDILQEVYNNAKLPIVDRSIFIAAFNILRPRGFVRYFGAFNDGNLIGALCLLSYKQCLYDWYAGSLRQYLNKYPNDLLPWEAFKWGKEHGYVAFDFGGAGKPGEQYGVREYKRKFGGEFVNFGRFQKIHKHVKYAFAKVGFSAWRFVRGRMYVRRTQT